MLRGFKITGKTCGKICICLPRVHFKKRSAKDLFDDVCDFFFLIFFVKAYVLGTHLKSIFKLMQFKREPTTYVFIEK